MEPSRDDFVIAIRSAFLKKGAQQKFSLLALLIVSIIFLTLETIDTRPLNFIRSIVKDAIYRGAQFISVPSQVIDSTSRNISFHFNVHEENKDLKARIEELEKLSVDNKYLLSENKKLIKILEEKDNMEEVNSITSKVIIDKKSPYIKSLIINKGVNSKIRKGMPVLAKSNFVGRIVETNFFSSRILLVTDLNSKIPVTIEPKGYQAILSGGGEKLPVLDFLPTDHELENGNLVYTSGKDGVLFPGMAIGKVKLNDQTVEVELLTDINQISYVDVMLDKNVIEEDME